MPRECDDGPFGRGTGGQLRYRVKVKGHRARRSGSPSPARTKSAAEARRELAPADAQAGAARWPRRAPTARALGRWSQRLAAGRTGSCRSRVDWGKQNLADLTQEATDIDIRWTDEGQAVEPEGECPASAGSAPGSPTTRGCSPPTASTRRTRASRSASSRRSRTTCARCATSPTMLNDGSGVVVHEVVADGSVWHGKDNRDDRPDHRRGHVRLQHRRDRQVPERRRADLALDGRRRVPRRDARLHAAQPASTCATQLDEDGDGWPEGNGNVERPGMGEEKLDNAVYYIRGLYDYADMARSAGQTADADAAEARADELAARFEDDVVDGRRGRVRGLAHQPGQRPDQPEALDRREPDGGRAVRRRRDRPGAGRVRARHGGARDAREQLLQRRAARQPRPVPHRLRRRPDGRRRVRHLLARHRR